MTRPHGTNACYHLDACRCQPCRDAANAYGRHMARMKAYGRWAPYVDADPARAHVLALRASGMGPKRIAEVSGVAHGSLAKLVYGDKRRGSAPSQRIRPETEAKILAVAPDPYPGGIVDGVGTRRRLRALVAYGYTQSELARRLGIPRSNFGKVLYAPPGIGVEERTRAAVAALYDALAMVPPLEDTPTRRRWADQARRLAASNRWTPPLGLDDDRLDDPTYKRNRESVAHGIACRGCGKQTKAAKRYCQGCWRERKSA